MPIITDLVRQGTCVIRIFHGSLTGLELIHGPESFAAISPSPERITHGLMDLSRVTSFVISPEEAAGIAAANLIHAESINGFYLAVVAPTAVGLQIASMYEQSNPPKGWAIHICQTREQAQTWFASVVPTLERRSSSRHVRK